MTFGLRDLERFTSATWSLLECRCRNVRRSSSPSLAKFVRFQGDFEASGLYSVSLRVLRLLEVRVAVGPPLKWMTAGCQPSEQISRRDGVGRDGPPSDRFVWRLHRS